MSVPGERVTLKLSLKTLGTFESVEGMFCSVTKCIMDLIVHFAVVQHISLFISQQNRVRNIQSTGSDPRPIC